ncbi:MAG: GspH/FimT family pseudopilin [Burkholderiales bacterium]|jgi:Tfp pilus assembly protein FimT|nr:GspH/FimT family pseudopilin [Burkholderiales bacterium]MBW8892834.1 GspH/FimT family pseudopilin [Burkholderiales bacterium]
MNRTANTRRNSRGFTLVELCAGVGICAALVSQAVPTMGKMQQEQKLRASAETLASDLRFARSEAARLSDSVYFRVSGKGANACYVLYIGVRNDCDCAGGQAICKTSNSAVIKTEWLPNSQPVRLHSNAETLEFQHRQGLVTQTGSIDLTLDSGPGIRQVIAITGRVRSCYTGAKLGGLSKCA